MNRVLRSSLGVALALPLLLGTSALATAEAQATSQAPTAVAQIAPQEKHNLRCWGPPQNRICHEHVTGHPKHQREFRGHEHQHHHHSH
ncbi:hypothetical protein A8926_4699 [Saccharopolyspora spinosa]|uniref:Secreted protein n=1 Tax=Saccharopolyspora spinosa TaxID=60894 RepID=A0A2N3Y1Q0_SACSN|nr:hypothetical protein A8926_4699 [Saccharopolyspora spinosa]